MMAGMPLTPKTDTSEYVLLQTSRSLSVKCKHTTWTEEEWKSPPQKDFDDVNASYSG